MSGTPILMYHAFADGSAERSRYVISRRQFRLQMLVVRLLRFRVLSLGAYVELLERGQRAPRRSVVLTIDDGYVDNYRIAYPILRRHGFPATLFVTSGKLGGINDWDPDSLLSGRPLLDGDQVRELAAGGIEIGAHTRVHPSLPGLDPARLRDELAGGRSDLEALLNSSVDLFAYPYGRFDEQSVAAVGEAGFRAAVTAKRMLNDADSDRRLLGRFEIRGDRGLPRFLAALAGYIR